MEHSGALDAVTAPVPTFPRKQPGWCRSDMNMAELVLLKQGRDRRRAGRDVSRETAQPAAANFLIR